MDAPNICVADANGCTVPLPLAQLKDPVEFSNACRAFYNARVEATEKMKELVRRGGTGDEACKNTNCKPIPNSSNGCTSLTSKNNNNDDNNNSSIGRSATNNNREGSSSSEEICDGQNGTGEMAGSLEGDLDSSVTSCVNNGEQARARRRSNKERSAMDTSMDVLRREMAGLMELDLRLMKQLLILNEEIEDLKWRRRHAWGDNCASSQDGSCDMLQSAASLSNRLEMQPALKFSTPSSLSLQLEGDENIRFSVYDDDDHTNTFNRGEGRAQMARKTPTCTVANVVVKSSQSSGKTKPVLHQNKSQDQTSPTKGPIPNVSENFVTLEAQNTCTKLTGSSRREYNGHAVERDNTTTVKVQSLSKLVPNQRTPILVNEENGKHLRKSHSLPHDRAHTSLKTPTVFSQKGISTPHRLIEHKRQELTKNSMTSTNLKTVSSKTFPGSLTPDSNQTPRIAQTSLKNSSRKPHSPRATETSTKSGPHETPVPDSCITPVNNSSTASAVVKPKHAGKMVATHRVDCSHTSAIANDQISLSGYLSPASGHRKKSRNKLTTPIVARNSTIGSAARQPKRKAKGPNKVVNGDAESHDSGINDIFS